jgi:membrane-bound lytic murein transglycosylase D
MQLIIDFSKYIVLALLSIMFLTVWYSNNNTLISELTAINTRAIQHTSERGESSEADAASIDSVWSSISDSLTLDHKENSAAVKKEIRKILAERNKLNSILAAAGPYIYYIYAETQARGLPAEIALIPIIESEFNPNDHSDKGATGLWQLMPQTAHDLGIHIKSGYDGRRNVIASTRAALAYFRDLGVLFKSNWYLAIAAYNCGEGKVGSAIHHAGSRNFWDLHLPKETTLYVPKLLAIAAIVKNPKKYGIKLPSLSNGPYFAELKTKTPVNLSQISKKTGIELTTLNTLNPDYKNGKVPKKGPYTLLIPVEDESTVKNVLNNNIAEASSFRVKKEAPIL